jgi:hypothetical protein
MVYNTACNERKMMSQHTNLTIKSTTARLLATENIQVTQTNSKTAWFDVEKRVLNLPLWDVEPYVYDMLVGHEVGHALYTPAQGWHDAQIDLGIPRSYINVVEDARIEKLIKSKYPGLVYTFTRAYSWMHDEDFFKIQNRDLHTMKLIDRINLHFKLGGSMKVPFSDIEFPFIDKVAQCDTFEDVVRVSTEILNFWKDNKEEIQDQLEGMGSSSAADDEYDDFDDDYDFEESDGSGDESEDSSTDVDPSPDEAAAYDDNRATASSGGNNTPPEDSPDDISDTDEAQRSSEHRMLNSESGDIIKLFPESMLNDMVVSYKEYYASERKVFLYRSRFMGYDRYTMDDHDISYPIFCDNIFKIFMTETNRAVSYMAKEFEQKKAAFQYSRAKTSTSGTLNTSALYKYKFSEDIFKRITTLADAKSHGMMISIDMSGSMSDVMIDTVKQALNLALFCRRVNIPFEMYGYTDGREYNPAEQDAKLLDGTINPYDTRLTQFFSHKMNKREFDTAVKQIFMMACGIQNTHDRLGSTPTNEALIAISYLLKRFRKATGVQKMMNIVLSDGEPNRTSAIGFSYYRSSRGTLLQVSPTKFVKLNNVQNDLSVKLLEYIKKECDVTNFGYFLGDSHSMKMTIIRLSEGSYDETARIKSEIRKHGSITMDNALGYDRYVVIRNKSFCIEDGAFEVAEDANKSTIAREFSKFTKGKRTSRVLLDKFVQCVV